MQRSDISSSFRAAIVDISKGEEAWEEGGFFCNILVTWCEQNFKEKGDCLRRQTEAPVTPVSIQQVGV